MYFHYSPEKGSELIKTENVEACSSGLFLLVLSFVNITVLSVNFAL